MMILEKTLSSIKQHRSYPVAVSLIKHANIFNCSLEKAWDEIIHPAVHQAHEKETVISLASEIIRLKKQLNRLNQRPKKRSGFQCELKNHNLVIQYVLEEKDRYRLEVYKGISCIYRHHSLAAFPFNQTTSILRNKLNITKVKLRWERF